MHTNWIVVGIATAGLVLGCSSSDGGDAAGGTSVSAGGTTPTKGGTATGGTATGGTATGGTATGGTATGGTAPGGDAAGGTVTGGTVTGGTATGGTATGGTATGGTATGGTATGGIATGGTATGGTAAGGSVVGGSAMMPGGAPAGGQPQEMNRWYETCGDPVCMGNNPMGLMACGDMMVGQACDEAGATCDFGDMCNARLICASEDPKGPGGAMCPRSKAKYKNKIRYLTESDRKALADAANNIKLARWRYIRAPQREHIGFIIDDQPHPALVRAGGEHVDLYGYTSLAVAAIQQQAKEIKELRQTIDALSTRVEKCVEKNPEK